MGQTEFNHMLLESVNETISIALGRPITEELSVRLQAYIGLTIEEMPNQIYRLFQSVSDSFGTAGDDLCKLIVKKMYQKAGVLFYEIAGKPMIQYIEELKAIVAKTNP